MSIKNSLSPGFGYFWISGPSFGNKFRVPGRVEERQAERDCHHPRVRVSITSSHCLPLTHTVTLSIFHSLCLSGTQKHTRSQTQTLCVSHTHCSSIFGFRVYPDFGYTCRVPGRVEERQAERYSHHPRQQRLSRPGWACRNFPQRFNSETDSPYTCNSETRFTLVQKQIQQNFSHHPRQQRLSRIRGGAAKHSRKGYGLVLPWI